MSTSATLLALFLSAIALESVPAPVARAGDSQLELNLRTRPNDKKGQSPTPSIIEKKTNWAASKTAIIVVDMWDDHWCKGGAARRVSEMAVPMNQMLKIARSKGVLIIHAPSSVTAFYKDTPQRKLAASVPFVPTPIPLSTVERWGTCWLYPDKAHEAELPIDDSDMGCDCEKHCTIREAWTRENPLIQIAEGDAITDNGQEAWNLLQARGIDNVILCGVHLNMCVLGRPVGIRQMVKLGKNVALMRDMTDTMYNHERRPNVDHFQGTELVIEHVEKYWCPSFISSDITGGSPFQFKEDTLTTRPTTTAPASPWGVKQVLVGEPKQPHVLCIGDSILGGYHTPLAELLRGKASLDIWVTPRTIADKSLPATMKEIFAEHPYDVIVFNDIGLHAWQPGRIPEGQYEPLLRSHVDSLRKFAPNARLIFATTTPMTTKTRPIAVNGEFNPLIVQRNAIAAKVMEENHIPVIDYYQVLINKLDLAAGDGFHWKKPAYESLAELGAGRIWQVLGTTAAGNPPDAARK